MNYSVTIGIPLYNSLQYISQTLLSALDQSYPNIEILVVDDCSTDGSLAIVKNLQHSHPSGSRIRILEQPFNKGVSAARNRIIEEATGCFLYFLDSDDYILGKDVIALMVNHQQRTDADIVIGSYEKKWVNSGKKEVFLYEQRDFLKEDTFAIWAFRKYGGIQASSCNYMVALPLLRNIGIVFYDTDFLEDYVFTYELITYVTNVVTLPDITYCYQFHEGSLSHSQNRDVIPKQEIEKTIQGFSYLKDQSGRLLHKPYISSWAYNLLMTSFYIVCSILHNGQKVSPQFTVGEMKAILYCPLPIICLLKKNDFRLWNIIFCVVGHLPALICVFIVKIVGKRKGLI